MTLGGWHCGLRLFKLGRPLHTGFEPRSRAWLACSTGQSATTYTTVAAEYMPYWILRANRARAVPRFGMVQNTYPTRTVQYQRIYDCILFWKIMVNRSLIVILRPICGLLKQIINHYRSKFVLSKLVLIPVCCKHFMYTCMHRSCTLSCVHVECISTYFVIRLLFKVQNSDNIHL